VEELLVQLRRQFPQPVSDPAHDAYIVSLIQQLFDQVDSMKGQSPVLGSPVEPDYASALAARMAEHSQPLEEVIRELVRQLRGMLIWGHPRSQVNVIVQPSIAGIIGMLLASIYNPNLCSDESGRGVSAAEVRAAAMTAELVGYDPNQAEGIFTFGGTGCMLYGVKVGLEKCMPGSLREGIQGKAVVLASAASHYSVRNVAGWLGLGQDRVLLVPTGPDNAIRLDQLAKAARGALGSGQRIAAIVATLGSTDAFGLDDLERIHALRDELVAEFSLDYRPHLHADAVIGWAWSVFNDYDQVRNELGFRARTVRALAAAQRRIVHLPLADSIGIDFHKTAYAPFISSLVLFRERHDLELIRRRRESMPYLYQSGERHPGMYTLETSRSGAGPMAALANLLLLGKAGLRALLGHSVEMAEFLREELESHGDLTVLNTENVGPVTLFRVYPPGVDASAIKDREQSDGSFHRQLLAFNRLNQRVFERVHAEALTSKGVVISMTDCYRVTDYEAPIAALKSYVLSPFSDEGRMRALIEHVLVARDAVLKGEQAQ